MVFCPETLMARILSHIHYQPDHWKNQAHTSQVRDEFGQLFQLKAVSTVWKMAKILRSGVQFKSTISRTWDMTSVHKGSKQTLPLTFSTTSKRCSFPLGTRSFQVAIGVFITWAWTPETELAKMIWPTKRLRRSVCVLFILWYLIVFIELDTNWKVS